MIRLTLPWPPSANAMWRAIPRGGHAVNILSKQGREFFDAARLATGDAKVQSYRSPVAVTLRLFPARRGTDLDNRIKPVLDCLQGRVIENDRQVCELHAYRHDPDGTPRVEVEIEEVRDE